MGGGSPWEFSSDSFIQRHLLSARLLQVWDGEFSCSQRWPGDQSSAEGEEEPRGVRTTQPAASGPGGE